MRGHSICLLTNCLARCIWAWRSYLLAHLWDRWCRRILVHRGCHWPLGATLQLRHYGKVAFRSGCQMAKAVKVEKVAMAGLAGKGQEMDQANQTQRGMTVALREFRTLPCLLCREGVFHTLIVPMMSPMSSSRANSPGHCRYHNQLQEHRDPNSCRNCHSTHLSGMTGKQTCQPRWRWTQDPCSRPP